MGRHPHLKLWGDCSPVLSRSPPMTDSIRWFIHAYYLHLVIIWDDCSLTGHLWPSLNIRPRSDIHVTYDISLLNCAEQVTTGQRFDEGLTVKQKRQHSQIGKHKGFSGTLECFQMRTIRRRTTLVPSSSKTFTIFVRLESYSETYQSTSFSTFFILRRLDYCNSLAAVLSKFRH